MRYFFLYYIFRSLFRSPLAALLLIFIIYSLVDRQYIGLLPDYLQPWRSWLKISRLRREIELYPLDGRNLYELGALLAERGRMKEARKYLEQAHSMMPEHPDVLYYFGVACLQTGQVKEGKESLEKALAANPKVKYGAPYIYLIEYTLFHEPSEEKVREYLEKLAEYGSPEYYYKLGLLFARAGRREQSREMYNLAVANFQGYPSFYKKSQRTWAFRARLRKIL